jgi:heme exporter protein A
MTLSAPLTLKVDGLAAERAGRPVLAGLSFTARAGEAVVVTGRNGAGKSTLLRVLAGLLLPTVGRVALDPPDVGDPDTPVAERAHYLGHLDALKPALTPLDHLGFAAALLGRGLAPASPREALERLALSHVADLPCGYLSAGQRRRVALARLLVARRPLWLLDEPATALDAAAQAVLAEVMREHLAGGGLVVAATHGPLGLEGLREIRLEPGA